MSEKFITVRTQGVISPTQHDMEIEITLMASRITLTRLDDSVPDNLRLTYKDPDMGPIIYKMGAMGFDIAKEKLEAL